MKNQTQYDVIIIGAGAAGIGAAVNLSKQGISYIVLQARERIGGRTLSKSLDGFIVDLGGSWIHSFCEQNPLSKYVKDFDIKQIVYSDKSNEQVIRDAATGIILNKQTMDIAARKCQEFFAYSKQVVQKSQTDLSIFEAGQKYFQQNILNSPPLIRKCTMHKIYLQQCYEASTINQLSARNFLYEDYQYDFLPQGGYGQLYKKIAATFQMKVELNKIVKQISYEKSKVIVECADGSIYYSKKIISSLPLGVLKAKKVKFSPQLPKDYQLSIQRLGNGLMNKIFVLFQKNFWGDSKWIINISEDRSEFCENLNYSLKGKNILCCFLTGDFAKKYQKETDEVIMRDFLSFLSNIYGQENVKMKEYFITRWGKDQFSLGSYSSFHVGSSPFDCFLLRKPIQETVWIVGEHCWAESLGTAHGAFKTGELAAQQTIKLFQLDRAKEQK